MHARCFRTPRLSRRAACMRAVVGILGGFGLLGPRRAVAQDASVSPCLTAGAAPGEQTDEARNALADKVAMEIFKRAVEEAGGEVIDPTDHAVLGPLIEYLKDPAKGTVDATVNQIVQNVLFDALKVAFPLYSLVVEGGKFAIAGGLYATEQLLAYGHDAQVLAILNGTEEAPLAGRIGNPLADAPLAQYSGMTSKGATLENLAVTFPKFQDLQTMWTGYATQMWDARSPERAYLQTQLWPMVEKLWKAQRLEIINAEIRAELKRQIELRCKSQSVDDGVSATLCPSFSDFECPAGQVCRGGACMPGDVPTSGCVSDAECPYGDVCAGGVCIFAGECFGDSDCPSDRPRCNDQFTCYNPADLP
jgi:hypothetical protein